MSLTTSPLELRDRPYTDHGGIAAFLLSFVVAAAAAVYAFEHANFDIILNPPAECVHNVSHHHIDGQSTCENCVYYRAFYDNPTWCTNYQACYPTLGAPCSRRTSVCNDPTQCGTEWCPDESQRERRLGAFELETIVTATSNLAAPGRRKLASSTTWVTLLKDNLVFFMLPVGLGILTVFTWMQALNTCASTMVYGTLYGTPIVLFVAGVACIVAGTAVAGPSFTGFASAINFYFIAGFFCVLAILKCILLCCWRDRIKLTAALVKQATVVSKAHPAMYLVAFVILVVSILVAAFFLAVAYIILLGEGKWDVPPPATSSAHSWSPTEAGDCVWSISTTQKFLFGCAAFFAYWAFELFFALRFATISLTTGIWYYEEATGALPGASEDACAPLKAKVRSAPVTTAFKLMCTKSLGSLCLASLVITIVEILKALARQARRNNSNLLVVLIACCIECILNFVQWLTKFGIAYHALTGKPFCESTRLFMNHLNKFNLAALGVDVLANMVLSAGAVVLSLLVGLVCTGLFYLQIADQFANLDTTGRVCVLVVPGVASWYIAWIPLSFVSGVLLNIIDAAYSCLVLDLEGRAGEAHPQLAYAVFSCLKRGGKLDNANIVIQQPGGSGPVIAVATPVGQPGAQMGVQMSAGGRPIATPVVNTIPVAQPVAKT